MYQYTKQTFSNGLRLVAIPMKNTKTVTVLVMVGVGSKYETKKINGISHFLEHMFFKGTQRRPTPKDITETIDRVGGKINAFTGEEYSGYCVKIDQNHLDTALDIISDMLVNSKFEETEIKRERGVILEEINMYNDMPQKYVQELFEKLLYGDQPAGWRVIGEKEIIMSIKRSGLLDYLKNHYIASNMTICISGNFDLKTIKDKVIQYFAKIKIGQLKNKLKTKERQAKSQTLLHFKKTDQTHFCLGVRSYDLFHPLRFAQEILAIILGGNMSSRLFTEVREKQGLAYYIYSEANESTDTGCLVTRAGVDSRRVNQAINAILKEYREIKTYGIKNEELDKAKDFIQGRMALDLESSDEIASFFAGQEILKNEIETPEEIIKRINAVTVNDIKKVAKDIFKPEKLNLAMIGPFKDKGRFSKLLIL